MDEPKSTILVMKTSYARDLWDDSPAVRDAARDEIRRYATELAARHERVPVGPETWSECHMAYREVAPGEFLFVEVDDDSWEFLDVRLRTDTRSG